MTYRKSKSSGIVTIRLPNEIISKIERRVAGPRSRWGSVGDYLKERIIYDVRRDHKRKSYETS